MTSVSAATFLTTKQKRSLLFHLHEQDTPFDLTDTLTGERLLNYAHIKRLSESKQSFDLIWSSHVGKRHA